MAPRSALPPLADPPGLPDGLLVQDEPVAGVARTAAGDVETFVAVGETVQTWKLAVGVAGEGLEIDGGSFEVRTLPSYRLRGNYGGLTFSTCSVYVLAYPCS